MAAQPATAYLELSIADPMQLFNSMDPSPFRERDLDSEVVTYIVEWAREVAANTPLGLVVNLHREGTPVDTPAGAPGDADMATVVDEAVHLEFRWRARAARRRLKRLLRDGRISLVIGLAFLASAIFISDFIGGMIHNENYAWLLQESVVIGGWVALWHPLNIFLYDWWPIRSEIRLYDRLGEMEVRLVRRSDPRVRNRTVPPA